VATLRKGWQQVPDSAWHYFRPAQRLSICGRILRGPQVVEVRQQRPDDSCRKCVDTLPKARK